MSLVKNSFAARFNTQPPEGGWTTKWQKDVQVLQFQHTAARRRLAPPFALPYPQIGSFNTQPPEGGWQLAVLI